ncbi:hypothetical protein AVEN_41315-1 [Araneus ventricosus]|uniref:Uncharacterized protein n=1 Tax=Araneus ventricosus TaxID=182803 RepID=A0A4Y2TVV5_ARAVE|nr:hypothetical protein AVEN_41315-1 [Araneus ventricosus]
MANSGLVGWSSAFGPSDKVDLVSLDYSFFFLWGTSSLVYGTLIMYVEDLVGRIAAAAGEVRDMPGIFANVPPSMMRCEACVTTRGRNFEHLL